MSERLTPQLDIRYLPVESFVYENQRVAVLENRLPITVKFDENTRVVRNGFDGSSRMLSYNPHLPLQKRQRESSDEHRYFSPSGLLDFNESHGLIVVYDRKTLESTLVGTKPHPKAETTFLFDPDCGIIMKNWLDNVFMEKGSSVLNELIVVRGNINEALNCYRQFLSPDDSNGNVKKQIASLLWQVLGKEVGAKDILAHIEIAKKHFGLDLVWIDDGHSPIGDPMATDREFLKGTQNKDLGEFVKQVHDLGIKVGLWVSPFEVSPTKAKLLKEHPDFIVRQNGQPLKLPGRFMADGKRAFLDGWLKGIYLLDLTNPEVKNHLFQMGYSLVDRFDVDAIKADFLNRAFNPVFIGNDENLTRVELYKNAMDCFISGINTAAFEKGKNVEILLCQAPIFSSLDLNNGLTRQRYTDDTWPFPTFSMGQTTYFNWLIEKLHYKLNNPLGWFDRAAETAFWRRFLGNLSEDDGIILDEKYGIDLKLVLSYIINSQFPRDHTVFTIGDNLVDMNEEMLKKLGQLINEFRQKTADISA